MSARTIITGVVLSVVMVGAMARAQMAPRVEERERDRTVVRRGTGTTDRDYDVDRMAPRFIAGDRTLALSGSGTSDKDFDANIASLELELGWLIADDLALAVRQGIGFADTDGQSDWNASTRLGMDYFLNVGRLKPFVGASIGYIYGDTVKNQFIAGPDVGLRYFVNDTTFINLVVEYQFLFEDSDQAKETYKDGRFVYALGMGVKW